MICIHCLHEKEKHTPNGCIDSPTPCACLGFTEMTIDRLVARKKTLEMNEIRDAEKDYSQDWLFLAQMYERLEGRYPFYKYCMYKAAQYHPEIGEAESDGDDDDEGHEYQWQNWSNR